MKRRTKKKNRYNNILPYDQTRVKLTGEKDYINANYVIFKGYENHRYIAAQGPMPNTIGDFWLMVFDQKVLTVVMLTNEIEAGRRKCEHYWPPLGKGIKWGDIGVKMVEEHVKANYTVREFQVIHLEKRQGHKVQQFHFTTWPDFGVPASSRGLCAMIRAVRKWNNSKAFSLIHCSAGVGRTGTYCLIDAALRDVRKGKRPSVFKLATEMREQRSGMIQTVEQYEFCYGALSQCSDFTDEDLDEEDKDLEVHIWEDPRKKEGGGEDEKPEKSVEEGLEEGKPREVAEDEDKAELYLNPI